MKKQVLVLNHFAVPLNQAGGTRHVELFNQLSGNWEATIVAADRNLLSAKRVHTTSGSYVAVPTTPYRGSGLSRVMNWVSYAVNATWYGVRRRRIDVVYASSPHLLTGLAGWLIARLRSARFVLEIRDLWPSILVDVGLMRRTSFLVRLLHRIERFLYEHADEIVVLARGSAWAIRETSTTAGPITFIPNGSDPMMFAAEGVRDELRSRVGLTGTVFVYAGAHGPANGLDYILEAAADVHDDHPDVMVLLVGDGVEKARIVAEAERRELTNVRFLDPIPKGEMADLLRACDVGLHVLADVPLFRYGVSPNKVFDYMAAGLPVATNCPGEVTDVVDEAGAGFGVEPWDLSSAIRRMAAVTEEQRDIWGRSGRRFVERERSRAVLGRRLLEVLERSVSAP